MLTPGRGDHPPAQPGVRRCPTVSASRLGTGARPAAQRHDVVVLHLVDPVEYDFPDLGAGRRRGRRDRRTVAGGHQRPAFRRRLPTRRRPRRRAIGDRPPGRGGRPPDLVGRGSGGRAGRAGPRTTGGADDVPATLAVGRRTAGRSAAAVRLVTCARHGAAAGGRGRGVRAARAVRAVPRAGLPCWRWVWAGREATLGVPHTASTVVLAVDVSNSMSADGRRADSAGRGAAGGRSAFVEAQPDSVDIGVVAFGTGGLTTLQPTADHAEARRRDRPAHRLRRHLARPGDPGRAVHRSSASRSPCRRPRRGRQLRRSGDRRRSLGYWPAATIVRAVRRRGHHRPGRCRPPPRWPRPPGSASTPSASAPRPARSIEVDGLPGRHRTRRGRADRRSRRPPAAATYRRATPTSSSRSATRWSSAPRSSRKPVELTAPAAGLAVLVLAAGGVLLLRSQGRLV